MVVGKLSLPDLYGVYSDAILKGLEYLRNITDEIPIGSYTIDENMYANIMDCELEEKNICYEAHRRHLDIHYVLRGKELIKWSSIDGLILKTPYDEEKDNAFYISDEQSPSCILLKGDLFAIMFPRDGHSCLHLVDDGTTSVKKVVVKILI